MLPFTVCLALQVEIKGSTSELLHKVDNLHSQTRHMGPSCYIRFFFFFFLGDSATFIKVV